jgi:hypothetical protein
MLSWFLFYDKIEYKIASGCKNLFYHHLLEGGIDASHIIRFAFDSADDLYLIGESLMM